MPIKRLFTFGMIALFPSFLLAQKKKSHATPLKDTVLLMNGVTIPCTVLDSSIYGAAIEVYNKKGKKEKLVIEGERVYSIKFSNGGEKIVYRPGITDDGDFTIDEARYFIWGEQDAEKNYKSPWTSVGGGVIGVASGSLGNLVSILPPFAYSSFLLLPRVKVKKSTVRDERLLSSDAYLLGYERVARKRKVLNSLKTGALGLVVGLTVNALVFN